MNVRILIVDDEPTITRGLRFTLPWGEIGAEIVGEAYNGEQALQLIEQIPVDIVLSDVRMPSMDGLQLAEVLAQREPPVKMIMMSGYDDFEYVRKALRFGVRDYLLKPVDVDELMELASKLILEIQKEKEQRIRYEMELISNQMMGIDFGEDIFRDLRFISCAANFRIVLSEILEYGILIKNKNRAEKENIRACWKQWIEQNLRTDQISVLSSFIHQNMLLTVCFHKDGSPISDGQIGLLTAVFKLVTAQGGFYMNWIISDTLPELRIIREVFPRMVGLLKRQCHAKDEYFFTLKTNVQEYTPDRKYPKEQEKKLLDCFFQQKANELKEAVEELFTVFRCKKFLLSDAYQVCNEIKMLVYRRLRDHMKDLDERDSYFSTIDLQVYNSFASLQQLFMEELLALYEFSKQLNIGKNRWIMERVKKYIHEHYDHELKASELAEMIKVTPNYFSLIFKQETGKTYNEYLNEYRIEKAKELLVTTNDLVYEIAERVGYKEYKYFSNLFKKITGTVPSEYRDYKKLV